MRRVLLLLAAALLIPTTDALAQSGKIAGRVTEASTGGGLPAVNVAIVGMTQGAVTDPDGYYTILNVRPGTYSVRASMIGFTPVTAENVEVNIDLTTELNFALQEAAVGLEEVVVTVERPVVQRDVSASLANISTEQMESLPVASVAEVISLQAGFEPGLEIRGSGGNQVAFAVDGITYTNPRSNNPNTEISFTSIDEVQVQTGGFSAEYGNVRSGLINVVTKDPDQRRYTADVLLRYSPASPKHFTEFGSGFADVENSFWAYPRLSRDEFLNPATGEMCEVSLCGVGILPQHLRTQYEQFGGWNSLAEGSGYTPEQLRKANEWVFRKDFDIAEPDYEVDGTVTGPIPGIGPRLGNLRFSASFRQAQEAYVNPGQRPAETRQTFQGKLVSDVGRGMRLAVSGIYNETEAIAFTGEGQGYINVTAEVPQYTWDDRVWIEGNLAGFQEIETFGDWFYSPHDITNTLYGAEFTHTLSSNTFYEVKLQRNAVEDLTGAPDARLEDATGNSLIVRCVTPSLELREASECAAGEVPLTEAPFGYKWRYETTPTGHNLGSQRGDARDTSNVVRWSGRFDLTSQLNRFMQVKSGAEFLYSDYDVFYGSWDPANPHQENERYSWDRSPIQGALYGQTKLEFRGMVANLGLRADYFHAGGEWYDYSAFSTLFSASQGFDVLDVAETEATERNFTLSPRMGVSFPVTDDSKFYFNYGHFRQMPDPYRLFEIQYGAYTTQITRIGNPNIILPKTVAYELGFEQNLLDRFLVRIAGFYRDISDEGRDVTYVSIDELVNYARQEPLGWGDNRGFEITLEKSRGTWLRGFVNYTYLSRKDGRFGYGTIHENRRRFVETVEDPNSLQQNARVPEPYANMNLELRLPADFGPSAGGASLLGDWRVNLLGEWRRGAPSSWDIGGNTFSIRGAGNDRRTAYNVRWKDFWMFDMRLSKSFSPGGIRNLQFYVDVENVFDTRQLYYRRGTIFQGDNDSRDYFRSLHLPPPEELYEGLPEDILNPGYNWVPGNDQPGDYRKPGVPFDPIYAVPDEQGVAAPIEGALYYDLGERAYKTYANGAWGSADQSRVDQVLDDRAYIDMPNGYVMGFLNPRNVFFGIRLGF